MSPAEVTNLTFWARAGALAAKARAAASMAARREKEIGI
jgi:hypothetical protein